jgi:hypothetical protein
MSFAWFIEKNVTAEFFIYFIFLPIAIIPSTLINHAGRYTLPYPKCGNYSKTRKKLQYGRRGLHLARYYASLRNKSNIVRPSIITTFKGGRRFSYQVQSPKSTNPILTLTQRSFSASHQVDALITDNPSISLDLFLFKAKLYWDSMPQESLITAMHSSATVDSFLHSFNVIEHFNNIKSHRPSRRYRSIDSSTLQFQRILLEAKGLQTSIGQYGEILPLLSPAIYVSTNKDDLPIVIDTGASCTITPSLSDFTSKPTKPDTAILGSLTTVQTKVSGQGPIEWDIEDVLKKLRTTSYYVPELFSPQAYFKANPVGSLTLNNDGIFLHMPCGTDLKFPIQPGSNLPIMLT